MKLTKIKYDRKELSFIGVRGGVWKKFCKFFYENGFIDEKPPEAHMEVFDFYEDTCRIEEQIILENREQKLILVAYSSNSRDDLEYAELIGEFKDDPTGFSYKLSCKDYKEVYKSLDKTALGQSWRDLHSIYIPTLYHEVYYQI